MENAKMQVKQKNIRLLPIVDKSRMLLHGCTFRNIDKFDRFIRIENKLML